MKLIKATLADFGTVKNIVNTTINTIYPHYYPMGVVDFFLNHHSDDNIRKGLETETVLLLNVDGIIVGTGSSYKNEIRRLFVLPQFQRLSYGTLIINELENIISKEYTEIVLHSSLSSYNLYIKLGYVSINYNKIITPNKDVLFFNIMKKSILSNNSAKINFNNKLFSSISNTNNGEVSSETLFKYHQNGDIIWAEYNGGDIVKGFLIGLCDDKNNLHFTYQHINENNEIRTGRCMSTPEILPNGKIRMFEQWKWTNGDNSTGESIIEEVSLTYK